MNKLKPFCINFGIRNLLRKWERSDSINFLCLDVKRSQRDGS